MVDREKLIDACNLLIDFSMDNNFPMKAKALDSLNDLRGEIEIKFEDEEII